MKYLAAALILLMACSASSDDGPPPAPAPEPEGALLLVANKDDDTLTFLDAATLEPVGETTTGRGPHEVAAAPDGRWAFVANYEGPGDSISLIDVERREEVRKISIDPYRRPHGIAVSADGQTVYATVEGSQAIIELDAATGTIRRAIETGQQTTHMLALTPDGTKLYTANTVRVFDVETREVIRQIPTGATPVGILITPDGQRAFVANTNANTVTVLDLAALEVSGTIQASGNTPDGMAFVGSSE